MGNHISCNNYYCSDITFKPEWFSENSWKIEYNTQNKPYIIDKGLLKISNTTKFHLLLTKKLLIDFRETRNISIPINFKYNIKNSLELYIIISTKEINICDINNLNENYFFFIQLNLSNNKLFILHSFDSIVQTKKIKSKKINNFTLMIENNFNILLITENLKNKYESKYIHNFGINNDEFYLSLFLKSDYELLRKNQFIELNFE
jgi:hypothetical protein